MSNKPLNDDLSPEQQVLQSWAENAVPWIKAVREGQIASRREVTDQAIINAVMRGSPGSALDLGCGEGWLARALASQGMKVTGIDAIADLIDAARELGQADYLLMSYEDIAAGKLDLQVDVVVCNFSLIGRDGVAALFRAVPGLLKTGGRFVVQTQHPRVASGDGPYRDGWRPGSWEGFSAAFSNPSPWYFRTLESWRSLFAESGLKILQELEPSPPHSLRPASIIFIAEAVA